MKLNFTEREEKRKAAEIRLLENLRAEKQSLEKLYVSCNDHWGFEDPIYRFYHQSFKVFLLQESTKRIVSALRSLLPEQPINEWFEKIVNDGLGRTFTDQTNENWLAEVRPVDEFERQKRHAVGFARMECPHDVRVIEPPDRFPLATKPCTQVRFRDHRTRQHFQRDAILQLLVFGFVNDAHAALADHANDLVRSDRRQQCIVERRFLAEFFHDRLRGRSGHVGGHVRQNRRNAIPTFRANLEMSRHRQVVFEDEHPTTECN